MRYRVTFAAGLAVGFVMGTRAGRERYEQMKRIARRAADHPAVQQAAGAAAAQAGGLAKSAKAKVSDQVQQRASGLADTARQKAGQLQTLVPGRRDGNGDTAETGADATSLSARDQ
jgi:hypothetical protein